MNDRVIRSDKSGVYVINDRRRFRPANPTVYKKGDKVTLAWHRHPGPALDAKTQVIVYTWVTYPKGHPQNPTGPYTKHARLNEETWECHDPDPRVKERLKKGFTVLEIATSNGSLNAVVAGDDGYDYTLFRKDPTGYKPHHASKSTRGINVHLHAKGKAGHVQMTWDEWDKFVAQVNEQRDDVQVAPIAMRLQEEIDLDDQLQNYIRDKGLVPDTEPNEETDEESTAGAAV